MYWQHKAVQIAVFWGVIAHAVADIYQHLRELTTHTFRISDQNITFLFGGDAGLAYGIDIAIRLNIYTTFTFTYSQDTETDRNCISNYIIRNTQGGMTVHLLEQQPLIVVLPIPKITNEAIWIMSRMVINRRNLM
jgi:hypothetical protein